MPTLVYWSAKCFGFGPVINQKCSWIVVFYLSSSKLPSKTNLKIFYPPPYTWHIWDYGSAIPDFRGSMSILNPVDIYRSWCKLNFGPLQGQLNHTISLQFYWQDRRKETTFLLFINISWNNWQGTTLNNHLRYWFGFIITF